MNADGCVIGMAFAAVGAVIFMLSAAKKKERTEIMRDLAGRWNGRVTPGDFLTNPTLQIRVDGIDGEVTFHAGSKNSKAWTRVHFDWPSTRRLRVAPEGVGSMFWSMLGALEMKVGSVDFDSAFWIEASDPAWAKEVLAPDVRVKVLALRSEANWLVSNVVNLDIGPAGLQLKVSRLLVDSSSTLKRLVETAILILRQVRGTGNVSEVVIAAVEIKPDSECPVCGHGVAEGKVDCPSCKTPHHRECWTYSAGCAIFGCASRALKAAS